MSANGRGFIVWLWELVAIAHSDLDLVIAAVVLDELDLGNVDAALEALWDFQKTTRSAQSPTAATMTEQRAACGLLRESATPVRGMARRRRDGQAAILRRGCSVPCDCAVSGTF